MKVTCDLMEFQAAVALAGRAVSNRAILPVLGHILVQAVSDALVLTATDLETSIRATISARIDEPGAVTAPFRAIGNLAAVLEGREVRLSADSEPTLVVEAGKVQAHVKGFAEKEFPSVSDYAVIPADDPDYAALEIPAAALRKTLARALISASQTDHYYRPALEAVHFHRVDGALALESADGFRLSLCQTAVAVGEAFPSLLVPAPALEKVQRIVAGLGDGDVIRLVFRADGAGNYVAFVAGGTTQLAATLVEGRFPDCAGIIPAEHAVEIVVPVAELKRAVRSALVFARDGQACQIRLAVGEGKLSVAGESDLNGNQATDVQATVTGQLEESAAAAGEFFLDGRYLQDVLGVLGTEEVRITGKDASRPFAFQPMGDGGGDDGFTYVVMPQAPKGVSA